MTARELVETLPALTLDEAAKLQEHLAGLVGSYSTPTSSRGSSSPLRDHGELVGVALRTRAGVRPLFLSVGHRITLERAVTEVLRVSRYRIPEPLRAAHHAVTRARAAP